MGGTGMRTLTIVAEFIALALLLPLLRRELSNIWHGPSIRPGRSANRRASSVLSARNPIARPASGGSSRVRPSLSPRDR